MNFFAQQDVARRNSRLLTAMFLVAVFLLILLTNALVAAFLYFGQDYSIYSGSREGIQGFLTYFTWARFGSLALGITATVAAVVMVKWMQLSTGGRSVAESMGGSRILPQTQDKAERRCLNVVEEMSLAANMPVPAVYVMNGERGINAFAAGITPADAVVAVTRGTIEHLKRDELQGVIAHEFSHILNGDMRLNIRLAAMLKGITFIGDVGYFLLRSSNRARTGASAKRGEGGALSILGLVLWVLGWLGGLAAGFIKAAISRQKEFLADACAVQYTRDPDGIGDALKVIGGYIPGTLVHAARSAEMSHIFFGQIEHKLWQVFATHPPLAQRIRRIDADWNGQFINRQVQHYREQPSRPGAAEVGVGRAALVAAAVAAATLNPEHVPEQPLDADFGPSPSALEAETAKRHSLPVAFVNHSHDPLGASAMVMALLMSAESEIAQRQLAVIRENRVTGLEELVNTVAPGVRELHLIHRLPLLELCLPALKSMSFKQYRVFKNTLLQLIHADARTELYEWCLFQLVRHYLDPEFIQVKPSRARYRKLEKVSPYLQVTLSVLAHEGSGDAGSAFRLGADELGMTRLTLIPLEQCGVAAFSKSVHALADCYPLLKPRVLKAMALAASEDGKICERERELVACMAAVMDCPLPNDLLPLHTS
ncbi:MAG: Zn-dependent protease with chaperone function [Halieaceae bacterium]|jgi:Zn-dependent protease with chaperone function